MDIENGSRTIKDYLNKLKKHAENRSTMTGKFVESLEENLTEEIKGAKLKKDAKKIISLGFVKVSTMRPDFSRLKKDRIFGDAVRFATSVVKDLY